MIEAAWNIVLELAPWLFVGIAVAATLHVLLPPHWIARRLSGRWGVVRAVALGVPLPLCSCSVIPVGLSLRTSGASTGGVVGFLISTPQTGVDSVLVTAGLLGWPLAIFKLASAAVTGLVGGWVADAVVRPTPPALPQAAGTHRRMVWTRAWLQHADMLLRSTWKWLLLGVVVSAAITYWVPVGSLNSLSAYGGLPAMLVMLAISLPLYVCATASVPVAAALVAAGMPAGAAIVFLMAGPASNIATLGAVYQALGKRALAVYVSVIVVGSIACGLLFDSLMTTAAAQSAVEHHHHGPWSVWLGRLLIALMAWYVATDTLAWWQRRASEQRLAGAASVSVGVEGMTCGSCVRRLETALRDDVRIHSAQVTLSPGRAVVSGNIDTTAVKQLVAQAGFTPRDEPA